MAQRSKEALASHVQLELEHLVGSAKLPFRHLLSEERIKDALERMGVKFRKRMFDPLTTLYAFLSQAVASKGSSCEDAVSRVLAERVANNESSCSTDTSSYCKARGRLPEQVIADLARETGQELERGACEEWLWNGRHVKLVDGSTAEMADTPENQAEYPQSRTQKPGLGFPMMRIVVLFSLAVGTVLECAIGPCRGKKTGEQSLFRQIWSALEPGDIVLGDRLYDAYRDIAQLKARGVDTVFGMKQSRVADFRLGRKLGPNDHVVVWKRPKYDSTRFDSREEWKSLPEEMEMREIKKIVRRKGCRTRTVIVVTTLLDGEVYPGEEVTDLFAQRWNCELDLRSLKQVLGMHRLRCQSPEMARKELWVYLLAYNLIRVRMAQAAAIHGPAPRSLSFTAAKTHIHNFEIHMNTASKSKCNRLEEELLKAIASCCVGKRSGRKEPRAVKKRQQKYSYLTKTRCQARQGLAA
jgi:DDE family transposase